MSRRDEVVDKRVAEASPLYRQIMLKAYEGDCSPRRAIQAQCLICAGYDREAIRTCSGFSCPLWRFRPYIEGAEE